MITISANCLQCFHCNQTFPIAPGENTTDLASCVLSSSQDEGNEFGELSSCSEVEKSGNDSNTEHIPLCVISTSIIGNIYGEGCG